MHRKTFRFITNEAKGVKDIKEGYTVKRQGAWIAFQTALPGEVWSPERHVVVEELVKEIEEMLVY